MSAQVSQMFPIYQQLTNRMSHHPTDLTSRIRSTTRVADLVGGRAYLSGHEAQREEWPKLVARWEASGESAAVFARHVGANAMTLYRWRRELRSAESGPARVLVFDRQWGP